jgi:hypothetical protein
VPFWPPLMGIHGRLAAHQERKLLLERRHIKAQKTKQLIHVLFFLLSILSFPAICVACVVWCFVREQVVWLCCISPSDLVPTLPS